MSKFVCACRRDSSGREAWLDNAVSIIEAYAAKGWPFTTEDLWKSVEFGESLRDGCGDTRWIGVAIYRARRLGIVESIGAVPRTKGYTIESLNEAIVNPIHVWRGVGIDGIEPSEALRQYVNNR